MKHKLLALFFAAACTLSAADDLIVTVAHIAFRVADLEKTRTYYTGVLQIPVAYDRKDSSGKTNFAVLQINSRQFLEFSQAGTPGFNHIAFLTQKLDALHKLVEDLGLNPPPLRTGTDRTRNFTLPVIDKLHVEFTQYEPDSLQARSAARSNTVLAIDNLSLPVADPAATRAFFHDKAVFNEGASYLEFLPAGAPVRLRLKVRNPSLLHAGPDPDGVRIEFTAAN